MPAFPNPPPEPDLLRGYIRTFAVTQFYALTTGDAGPCSGNYGPGPGRVCPVSLPYITYSQNGVWTFQAPADNEGMTDGRYVKQNPGGQTAYQESFEIGTGTPEAWLQMDLGSVRNIGTVVVGSDFGPSLQQGEGGWAKQYAEDLEVSYSIDGVVFTPAFNTGTFTQAVQAYPVSFAARYIRIDGKYEEFFGFAYRNYAVTQFYALDEGVDPPNLTGGPCGPVDPPTPPPPALQPSLDKDPALQRIPLELGFDGTATHFLSFTLERRADVLIERVSDDPYIVHVGAYVSRRGERSSTQFIDSADGSSGWRLLPAGDYLIVVSMPFSVIQIKFDLIFGAKPHEIEAYGLTPDGDDECIGLLDYYFPDPLVDNQVVTRWRDFNWDLQLDTSEGGDYDFSFAGWSGVLEIYGDDPNVPLFTYPLDPDAIQTGRLIANLLPWQTAVLPDTTSVVVRGFRPNGRSVVMVIGTWVAVEPPGGPDPIQGLPAFVDMTIMRHADVPFAYDLALTTAGGDPVDFTGWTGWLELWDPGFVFRHVRVPVNPDNEPLDFVLATLPSALTSRLPGDMQMRSWLVDQDGGTHWLVRGDWTAINGYTRVNEGVVRDDRTIVAGADITYLINLLNEGLEMNLGGCGGYLRFTQLDGRPFGSAADAVIPLLDVGFFTSELQAPIPSGFTRELALGDVAMRLFITFPNGAGEFLAVAGRWTVLQGYTDP